MRILILNSARKFIGEAAHCLDLTRLLPTQGHEVQLIVREGSELETRAREAGVRVVPLRFNSRFVPKDDGYDLKTLRALIRDFRPDVLHVHRGKDHWLGAVAANLRGTRVPVVRTRHMVTPMHAHLFNRWLLRSGTARVIAVSQAAADSFGKLRPLIEPKLRIVYSSVDQNRFSPEHRSDAWRRELGVQSGEKLIGLIARFQNIKGQHILIRAADEVLKEFPDTRFLIAGRASDFKLRLYGEQATKLNLGDRLIMRDWLDDIGKAVASLDVGVLASLGSEGSSRVTYEYMASGVPVVATTVGCLPEIMVHRETGLLVAPNDAHALAAAIKEQLRDPHQASDMAAAALARVREKHSQARWIEETAAVYAEAIEAGRKQ